ncbi:MAG: hypothetical protein ABSG10_00785 [Terracidiphilus sp.]|jgi:hypothetical protein
MPDEIKVNAAKFDRILKRMVDAKPLPKSEISERIKTQQIAKRDAAFEASKKRRHAKKLGQ